MATTNFHNPEGSQRSIKLQGRESASLEVDFYKKQRFINGFKGIYLRELMILRQRFFRILTSFAVSPLLYILAFGLGVGRHVQVGELSYLQFLIPGLAAMSSMMQAFAINVEINVSRFYLKIFEEFQAAPITNFSYVCGEVAAGVTRAILASIVLALIAVVSGLDLHFGLLFWAAILLNATFFASLGVASAMVIKSHADQALVTTLVITPMAFLGGTFFPLEGLPAWARIPLEIIPLSHAAKALRAAALGQPAPWPSYLLLVILALTALVLAWRSVDRARD